MKKIIIAVLTAATVITSAAAVSAAGMHHRGMGNRTGVCTREDCPNNGQPVCDGTGWQRNADGQRRGCGERNPEYCPYR